MNHVHIIKPFRNQRGISLIEVVVSVGIAGILMISMLAMMHLTLQKMMSSQKFD